MLGSIDSQYDITIYVTPVEVHALERSTLDGMILYLGDVDKNQHLELLIDERQKNKSGFGIGLQLDHITIVFIGCREYSVLKNVGRVDRRHSYRDGSKIALSYTSTLDLFERLTLENLEWYSQNWEKLHGPKK